MKQAELRAIIREEIEKQINSQQLNEIYDLENVTYSPAVRKQVEKLVAAIDKTTLSKTAVAAMLNDIVMALGLNRVQISMYMNMIKQSRQKYNF